jgi:crossover junction endodeoxyribonuclease RuvC
MVLSHTSNPSRIILGLDPGSRVAGFAFVRSRSGRAMNPRDFEVVEAGALKVPGEVPHARRIGLLHEALYDLMAKHRPEVCVVERTFVDKNPSSALKLGEVRGAFIAACGRLGVQIEEITPSEVKKTITGNGQADKEMVALALGALMGFDRGRLPLDVTDALAISLCFGLKLARKWAAVPSLKESAHARTRVTP